MDEEVEASPAARRTPWPIGLHSVEEQRKKEEKEREQKTRQQPQEEQQLQLKEGEERHPTAGPQLEGLLEQDCQQEPHELQEQQQQGGQQLAELLDQPQPEPVAPQEPGNQEEEHLVLCSNCSIAGSQDLKETSRIKSSFIHSTRSGWQQLPILKDKLLESQEKLHKAYKDLLVLEEEKKEREAALAEV
ncbi:trichohyalin-like [Sorghum bicolor]|uniref:trichohyalin-like n=1 Tax=Sorghum bicolor TaxID=4558 RepID=UPI000B424DB8|nr:trichohyalin-like [Sorghum bicolor]|eukprot:XP_021309146.1 trichohyalin-like [Sorghum bicolor]